MDEELAEHIATYTTHMSVMSQMLGLSAPGITTMALYIGLSMMENKPEKGKLWRQTIESMIARESGTTAEQVEVMTRSEYLKDG